MNVTEAVTARRSIRAFLDQPVAAETIEEVLRLAARAPSGGNLQPWQLYLVSGEPLRQLKRTMQERVEAAPAGEHPLEYPIYPQPLSEPYRSRRYRVGQQLYELLGIDRDDKLGRQRQFNRNYQFFGAPAALFCYVDRSMGAPQWSDLGMYLQTVMLLLTERGLGSCPQECWSLYHRTVAEVLSPPQQSMLFCALAIGYPDPAAAVNRLVTERAPEHEFLTVLS